MAGPSESSTPPFARTLLMACFLIAITLLWISPRQAGPVREGALFIFKPGTQLVRWTGKRAYVLYRQITGRATQSAMGKHARDQEFQR